MSSNNLPFEAYSGRRVRIVHTTKAAYKSLVGCEGVVESGSTGSLGVRLDNQINSASSKGLFWFRKHELKLIDETYLAERDMQKALDRPDEFDYIAKVVLLEDNTKKEYQFAMYVEDYVELHRYNNILEPDQMVVVPVKKDGVTRFVVGVVTDVYPVPDNMSSEHPYSEVIGVVNADRYTDKLRRIQKESELIEIRKALETQLTKLAEERRTSSHYEHVIATMYPDNAELRELLDKMKEIENNL